jgi:MarR family transcriptional regulator, organic hydroperoxide resistance regulator
MASIQDTVGYALAQLCKAHRQSVDSALKQVSRESCGPELHVGQEMILLQLWAEEGLTQSRLAELLCVEPPTITKMLQRMEQAGLLVRSADPDDARVSRVSLTRRGDRAGVGAGRGAAHRRHDRRGAHAAAPAAGAGARESRRVR